MKTDIFKLVPNMCNDRCHDRDIIILYNINGKLSFYCKKCKEVIRFSTNVNIYSESELKEQYLLKKNKQKDLIKELNNIKDLIKENFIKLSKNPNDKKIKELHLNYQNKFKSIKKKINKLNINKKKIYNINIDKNNKEITKY